MKKKLIKYSWFIIVITTILLSCETTTSCEDCGVKFHDDSIICFQNLPTDPCHFTCRNCSMQSGLDWVIIYPADHPSNLPLR